MRKKFYKGNLLDYTQQEYDIVLEVQKRYNDAKKFNNINREFIIKRFLYKVSNKVMDMFKISHIVGNDMGLEYYVEYNKGLSQYYFNSGSYKNECFNLMKQHKYYSRVIERLDIKEKETEFYLNKPIGYKKVKSKVDIMNEVLDYSQWNNNTIFGMEECSLEDYNINDIDNIDNINEYFIGLKDIDKDRCL